MISNTCAGRQAARLHPAVPLLPPGDPPRPQVRHPPDPDPAQCPLHRPGHLHHRLLPLLHEGALGPHRGLGVLGEVRQKKVLAGARPVPHRYVTKIRIYDLYPNQVYGGMAPLAETCAVSDKNRQHTISLINYDQPHARGHL